MGIRRARSYFAAIHRGFPRAKLIVLEPFWIDSHPPDSLVQLSREVHAAAQANGATWIDTDGWLTPTDIGPDKVHPTLDGQLRLAEAVAASLRTVT